MKPQFDLTNVYIYIILQHKLYSSVSDAVGDESPARNLQLSETSFFFSTMKSVEG